MNGLTQQPDQAIPGEYPGVLATFLPLGNTFIETIGGEIGARQSGPASLLNGVQGQRLDLNGTDESVHFANRFRGRTYADICNGSYTFIVLFQHTASATGADHFFCFGSSAEDTSVAALKTNDTFGCLIRDDGSAAVSTTAGNLTNNGIPHVGILTRNGDDVIGYIDGVQIFTGDGNFLGDWDSIDQFSIGSLFRTGDTTFTAMGIYGAAIIGTAIPISEVQNISDNFWQVFESLDTPLYKKAPAAAGRKLYGQLELAVTSKPS